MLEEDNLLFVKGPEKQVFQFFKDLLMEYDKGNKSKDFYYTLSIKTKKFLEVKESYIDKNLDFLVNDNIDIIYHDSIPKDYESYFYKIAINKNNIYTLPLWYETNSKNVKFFYNISHLYPDICFVLEYYNEDLGYIGRSIIGNKDIQLEDDNEYYYSRYEDKLNFLSKIYSVGHEDLYIDIVENKCYDESDINIISIILEQQKDNYTEDEYNKMKNALS